MPGPRICPNGYTHHGARCYKAFSVAQTFANARQTCTGENAWMAMPRDEDTNTFIRSFVSASYQWIGLSDIATEGTWLWEDGSVLEGGDYEQWGNNEPNGNTHESCVQMRPNDWNDATCWSSYQFACETDADECASSNGNCSNLQTCVNSVGSYSCVCDDGYVMNSTTLECDVDA
ncbi:C-type lectin lectoxin-Lio3-like [Branchiostoma floridae x Branchiostoma belcheri]